MKKKLVCVLSCLAMMTTALAACGSQETPKEEEKTQKQEEVSTEKKR